MVGRVLLLAALAEFSGHLSSHSFPLESRSHSGVDLLVVEYLLPQGAPNERAAASSLQVNMHVIYKYGLPPFSARKMWHSSSYFPLGGSYCVVACNIAIVIPWKLWKLAKKLNHILLVGMANSGDSSKGVV
eukprot:c4214_g1_i2 orf=217-609(+)